jgi:hypothetical protein
MLQIANGASDWPGSLLRTIGANVYCPPFDMTCLHIWMEQATCHVGMHNVNGVIAHEHNLKCATKWMCDGALGLICQLLSSRPVKESFVTSLHTDAFHGVGINRIS